MAIWDIFKKKRITKTEVELEPIQESTIIPEKIEDFKPCHYKVLRRLKNHPVNEPFSGLMTLEVNIPRFIPVLLDLKLIKIGSYEETLYSMKNDTLKEISRRSGLNVSGNKDVLIERILSEADKETVQEMDVYSDIYVHTDLATKVIAESHEKIERESLEFFERATDLILEGKMNEAYRMICKRNAEKPVPPGLGCDWERWYRDGIKYSDEQIYLELMEESCDKKITATTIYSQMSGESIGHTVDKVEKILSSDDNAFDVSAKMQNKILSTEKNFESYEAMGIMKYKFLATLDERTCPICGALDGKKFLVSERKIGVNCPPMHDGCRCTTVSVIDEEISKKGTRFARDPVTKRGIKVPATMTYTEWREKYLDGKESE